MRIRNIFITLLALALAGAIATFAARSIVGVVESRSVLEVRENFADKGHTWARVQGDGLQIVIEGEAPSEAVRFRVISAASEIVDASRVIDNMAVADSEALTPPDFDIEILRNDTGVSLIGLIPTSTDREALIASVSNIANDQPVTDLLSIADYPAPQGWDQALIYAIAALEDLPRSKISITAGLVEITAISDSQEQQRQWQATLSRRVPDGVELELTISAPRPVITPFTVRFVMDEAGARFDACAADTEEAKQQILAAAIAAGAHESTDCALGLGVPSGTWSGAVSQAISTLAELGGGTLTFADTNVRLVAVEGTDPDRFDDLIGALGNNLPDVFALDAELPQPEETQSDGPPRFNATRSPEGQVQLRGWVADELMNTTAANFARAKFGNTDVTMRTRVGGDLPRGWTVQILAAIEALSLLSNGSVIVEPGFITIRGNTGDPDANASISRLMIDKLGPGTDFSMDVTYIEALDPVAGLPTPEECVEQIIFLTNARKITFEPSSAELSASARPIVDDIAEIFRLCPNLEIEIAGYTDSQGRDIMNKELSQDRADAVLAALRQRRIPVASVIAIGYGEENPIADNGTEAGRDANRRIEFRLIEPEVREDPVSALDELEAAAPDPETPEPETTDTPTSETEDAAQE